MVVGCDYDSKALYLCALHGVREPLVTVARLRDPKDDQLVAVSNVSPSLALAYQRLAAAAGERVDDDIEPHLTRSYADALLFAPIWIERGFGAQRNADWIMGAIAGALVAATRHHTRGAARLCHVSVGKKAVGAPGNCKKAIATACAQTLWRATYGTTPPTDHNILDAYAVAVAAQSQQ